MPSSSIILFIKQGVREKCDRFCRCVHRSSTKTGEVYLIGSENCIESNAIISY